jgi:isoquinoline 1-oxidoreductase beta subunit
VSVLRLTRRDLVLAGLTGAGAGGAGLVLGIWYGRRKERWAKRTPPREEPFSPNIYLAIDETDVVRVWLTKAEMGQGVMTALPAILADELDADWSRVEIVPATANRNYGNMMTAVSSSVRSLYDELRRAGASARAMLVGAAADAWGVPADACSTQNSWVVHEPTGRRVRYGAVASAAGRREVPADPPLKPASQRSIVGRSVNRLDIPAKTTGAARFGIDVRCPGMLRATVLHPPFGAELASYDADAARAVPGVRDIIELESGVAVIAGDTWSAFRGADAADATFTELDEPDVETELQIALDRGGVFVEGVRPTITPAAEVVEATYHLPFLAHAGLEPTNATAHVTADRCEIWAPTQNPQGLRGNAARHLDLDPAQVVVHTTFLGGGFGRRVDNPEAMEAVELSRRMGVPVQVTWTRSEDTAHDRYRPASLHRLRARLGPDGRPQKWHHAIASPSIAGIRAADDRVDDLAVQGATPIPYAIGEISVEWAALDRSPLPLGFWRSVGHSYTAFAVECFIDELARKADRDPAAYRRALYGDDPRGARHRAVLDRVLEMSSWPNPTARDRALGLAVHEAFESVVAQVVEVGDIEGRLRVHRVWAAVDCGLVIDPRNVRAQVEGGIGFGLSAARWGRIDPGPQGVRQRNFDELRLLRFAEMPEVEVALLEGGDRPGGVGEIGVPPIAPALANAVTALRGDRPRRLPLETA